MKKAVAIYREEMEKKRWEIEAVRCLNFE